AELRARSTDGVMNAPSAPWPVPAAPARRARALYHAPMLDPQSAERLIGSHLTCLPIESLPVGQCAGAVLRENIYAERDQPPFDRVVMDGIALSSQAAACGRRRFRVQAIQA